MASIKLKSDLIKQGFTVVELVLSITIISILLASLIAYIVNDFVIITRNGELSSMSDDSQNILRSSVEALRVGAGVRQSNTITDPNQPSGWSTNDTNFVIIIAVPAEDKSNNYIIDPSTGSPYLNELVYFRSGSTLYRRSLANPNATGNKLVTSCPTNKANSSCPADQLLTSYIQTISFTFYDQNNATTTDPLQARSIRIDLSLQRKTFGPLLTLNNSIRVTLRNTF